MKNLFFYCVIFSFWMIPTDLLANPEMGAFLKALEEEARSLSFDHETRAQLYLSEDPTIIKELDKSEEVRHVEKMLEKAMSRPQDVFSTYEVEFSMMETHKQKIVKEGKVKHILANLQQQDGLFWEAIAEILQKNYQRHAEVRPEEQLVFLNLMKKELLFLMRFAFNSVINAIPEYLRKFYSDEVQVGAQNPFVTRQIISIEIKKEKPSSDVIFLGETIFLKEVIRLKSVEHKPSEYIRQLLFIFQLLGGYSAFNGGLLFSKDLEEDKKYKNAMEYFYFFQKLEKSVQFILDNNPSLKESPDALLENYLKNKSGQEEVIVYSLKDLPFLSSSRLIWPLIYKTYDRFGRTFQDKEYGQRFQHIQTLENQIKALKIKIARTSKGPELKTFEAAQANLAQKKKDLEIWQDQESCKVIPLLLPSEEKDRAERARFVHQLVSQFASSFQARGGTVALLSEKKKKKKKKKALKKSPAQGFSEPQKSTVEIPADELPEGSESEEEQLPSFSGEQGKRERPQGEDQEEDEDVPESSLASVQVLPFAPPSVSSVISGAAAVSQPIATFRPQRVRLPMISVEVVRSDLDQVVSLRLGERICQLSLGGASPSPYVRERGQVTGEDLQTWVKETWRFLLDRASQEKAKEIEEFLNHFHPQGRTRFPLPRFNKEGVWTGGHQLYTIDLPHQKREPMPYLTLKHFLKAILYRSGFARQ